MEYSSLPALPNLPAFPNRMSARYSPAATRGNSAAPASAARARFPRSARHQLWHLVTPLLRALLLLSGLAAAGPARAQQTFTTFQAASLVVGQPNFTSQITAPSQSVAPGANCSAISSLGVLAVGSQSTGRVLLWNAVPTVNGQNADVIVGETSFTSTSSGTTAVLTRQVDGVAFSPDGRKLLVSDGGNNRVLIWNSIPTVNGQPADVVIGQTNFTTATGGVSATKLFLPFGLMVAPDGRLFVNDYNNNRVLVFNRIPTANGAAADVVIGQPNMTTNAFGSSANQLSRPLYTALAPGGQLLVSEQGNNRVVVFNTVPTTNGAAADVVIGQTGFGVSGGGTSATKFNTPVGVAVSASGQVAVGEFGNHRVLLFDAVPTTNGAAAQVVLGQPGFTTAAPFNGGVTASSMRAVYGVHFDAAGRLFVNGRDMNRVMAFGSAVVAPTITTAALAAPAFCVGTGAAVSFTVTGTFPAGNTFTAQLSDAAGSFAAPVSIGTLAGTGSGTVAATIPAATPPGTGYRVRVVGSSPATTGSDNGSNLAINALPTATLSGDATICAGGSTNLSVALTGTGPWSVTYTDGTSPVTVAASASPLLIPVSPATDQTYALTAVSDAQCTGVSFAGTAAVVVNTRPVVTAPANQVLSSAANACGASATFAATATGRPAPGIVYTIGSGAGAMVITSPYVFTVGTTTVTATATNACGSDAQAFTVTVNDNVNPTIAAPAAFITSTDAGQCTATAVALGTATAGDNCAGVTVTNDAPATFVKGATTVTWTATDASGNTASATQVVTVNDSELPVLNPLANLTANAPATLCGAVVSFAPTATDNCAGATVTTSPASGSTFAVGTTPVSVTATDASGNVSTSSFTVTVNDVTAPTVITRNISVSLVNGTATITAAQVNNGSSDACGIAGYRLSQSTFTCANSGPNAVTLTVTDIHGLSASAPATVTVTGTTAAPTIAVSPASLNNGRMFLLYLGYGSPTATLTASGGVSYVWSPAANLSSATSAAPVFTPTAEGTYVFTVTATNQFGCTATNKVTIVVEDVRCGNNNDKVMVCHNGHAICVAYSALSAHQAHGDNLGDCTAPRPAAASAAPASAQALAMYPNPTADNATVSFRPAADGQASVVVCNQLGQVVARLYNGAVVSGQAYTLGFDGRHLATGLYVCRLVLNGKAEMLRLTVAR